MIQILLAQSELGLPDSISPIQNVENLIFLIVTNHTLGRGSSTFGGRENFLISYSSVLSSVNLLECVAIRTPCDPFSYGRLMPKAWHMYLACSCGA